MPPVGFREATPERAIPWRHAIAEASAAPHAQTHGSAGNVDSGRAPRFPSKQSSESHANHTTYNVIRQQYNCRMPRPGSAAFVLRRVLCPPGGLAEAAGFDFPRHFAAASPAIFPIFH